MITVIGNADIIPQEGKYAWVTPVYKGNDNLNDFVIIEPSRYKVLLLKLW